MTQTRPSFMIDWSSRSKMRGPGEQSLGKLFHALRERLAPEAQGISLTYVDDRGMRKLNREHRGKNMTTDVLSFPSNAEKGAFLHLCGHDHEMDRGEMMALQAQLERELLDEEPLAMSLKRGRKPGSKVKKLKDGSRVVVTGRAAAALVRRERVKKDKKPKEPAPKRGPGRPRKEANTASVKRIVRRRRPALSRSGVIG